MRHIPSAPLSDRAQRWLTRWTEAIEQRPAADRKTYADQRWENARQTKTLAEITARLEAMNGPLGTHCMYCEYNEAETLDHFEPRARDPQKTFDWPNLHLACDVCQRRKLARFLRPTDGISPLSPRLDDPPAHLRMLPGGGLARTSERGNWTSDLFDLERPALCDARRDQWTALKHLIPAYATATRTDPIAAEPIADTLRRGRFRSVLRDLVIAARGPKAELLGLTDVAAAIEARPELLDWAELT